jgi:ElaB/YqjD/DUF883 family membrane-anchored ribosome-binding protein
MDEHRPGAGGAANTPPFPRLPDSGREPVNGSAEEQAFVARPESYIDPLGRPNPTPPTEADVPRGSQEREPSAPEASATESPGFTPRIRRGIRSRVEHGVERALGRLADQLDEGADRLERLADDQLEGSGARARAGDAVQATAGWMEGVADYLRSSDTDSMRSDLEGRVRDRPLQTLLIAVGAGWVVGRIMR